MPLTKTQIKDIERYEIMSAYENKLIAAGHSYIAGVDEAGRGPLAGPVFAAAVILNPKQKIFGLNDSKKVSEKKRKILEAEIKDKALAWSICKVDADSIDKLNILEATKKAMTDALNSLTIKADFILTDAVALKAFAPEIQLNIIKGDAHSNSIAAASILAKTARDAEMLKVDEIYPEYGFAQHKGYGTKKHYEALDEFGPCPIHRKTFLKSWYMKEGKN